MKQISTSGKFASQSNLFKTDQLDLSKLYSSPAQILKDCQYCNISFEGSWLNFTGEAVITLLWLAGEKAVGESHCYIRNVKGVESQWDGLRVEWKRKYTDSADGISNYLTNSFRQEKGKGSDKFSYKLKVPTATRSFKVKVSNNRYDGQLLLNNFAVEGIK